MRLIDADRLSEVIYDNVPAPYEDAVCAKEDCLTEIDVAPTVDAVLVVRCRECKFGTHFGDMEDEWIRCMNLHGNPLMPFDGFCSYGKRKGCADNG